MTDRPTVTKAEDEYRRVMGREPPASFPAGSVAAAQWAYRGGRDRDRATALAKAKPEDAR